MKAVQDMTAAELLEEQRRREANRAAGRPLDYVAPELLAQQAAEIERSKDVAEKDEQRAIRKMAIALGFRVYWLSQARATKQTPGMPDLWLAHQERGLAGWWETKRQIGGERSSAQADFADECAASGILYGFGDRYAFANWLSEHEFTPPPVHG